MYQSIYDYVDVSSGKMAEHDLADFHQENDDQKLNLGAFPKRISDASIVSFILL